jgi:pimeloyl-ACP methyl ester carboxylesterase
MAKYLKASKAAWGTAALFVALGCASKVSPAFAADSQASAISTDIEYVGYQGLTLKGTFLKPSGDGPFPAMLLLPGSGPSDRNSNQQGLQINVLKDIAESLAKNGVATLRFDKRAVAGTYQAMFPKDIAALNDFFSWQAFVGDAEASYNALKKQPGVDPNRVGILGHSEGGAITLAMAQDTHPRAVVLVSTAGRDLGTVMVEQIKQGYGAQFRTADQTEKLTSETERAVVAVRQTGTVPAGLPDQLKPLFPTYATKYLHDIFVFDPTKAAADLQCPALVVQGEKDVQISAERDAPKLMAAIPKGQGELYLAKGCSHCLKHPANAQDPALTGATDTQALDKIGAWSKAHL